MDVALLAFVGGVAVALRVVVVVNVLVEGVGLGWFGDSVGVDEGVTSL